MQVSDTTTSPQLDTAPSRAAFLFVIATAFLTATGMTIINPVIPFLLQRYVSNEGDLAALIGWISAAYAICAFLATPVLGALSDRFGRRPLLLICMLGSAVGYAIFGFGGALWVLFLGRIIDGITGGNFGIAFAYIADITPPQKRGTYFGLVGAIAGIGTILGPVIGGFAAHLGYDAPIYLAATLFLLNAVLGFFAMPESLAPQNRTQRLEAAHFNPFAQLRATLAMGQLRWLFLAAFLFELPFAAMVSTLAILIKDSLNWDADKIGLVFLAVGVTDIVVQGGLIGRLTALLGELRLAIICSLIVSIGYILIGSIALVGAPLVLIVGTVLLAGGQGIFEPSLNSIISSAVTATEQGRVQGSGQAIASLAFIFGPLLGGYLYGQAGHATPYWIGAGLVCLTIVTLVLLAPRLRAAHN